MSVFDKKQKIKKHYYLIRAKNSLSEFLVI